MSVEPKHRPESLDAERTALQKTQPIESLQISVRPLVRNAFFVFILTFLFAAAPLDSYPFASKGEGREALVVRNMVEQDNAILPLRNGSEIPSKPPFFHWMANGIAWFTGDLNEFSIRLPSALAAALSLALFFLYVSSRAGQSIGALSVLITASAFEWSRSASLARVDMVFTFWFAVIFVALSASLKRLKAERKFSTSTISILGVALGCGALTKGPAALIIPWMILGLYFLITERDKPLWQRIPVRACLPPFIISLVIATLWYVAAYHQSGSRFLEVQLVKENAARITGAEEYQVGHESPLYVGFLDLVIGFLPWSLLFPLLFTNLWKERRNLLLEDNDAKLFALLWVATFLGIISVVVSKRPVYFLPAYLPLAYLLATTVVNVTRTASLYTVSRRMSALLVGILAVASLLSTLSLVLLRYSHGAQSALISRLPNASAYQVETVLRELTNHGWWILPLLVLCSLTNVWVVRELWHGHVVRAALHLGTVTVLGIAIIGYSIFPKVALANSPRTFLTQVAELVPDGAFLYEYRSENFPLMYYSKYRIELITDLSTLPTAHDAYVVIREVDYLQILARNPTAELLMLSSNYAFIGREKLALVRYPGLT